MESGIPFVITSDDFGGTVYLNQVDPEFGEVVLVVQPDGATGFDGAAVRMTVEDASGRDGATVYASKRSAQYPGLKGNIAGDSPSVVHRVEQKLRRLGEHMRKRFALLQWTHSNGDQRRIRVALADRVGIQGDTPKEFILQMVSDDAAKYSEELGSAYVLDGGTVTVRNDGDMDSWPRLVIEGALSEFTMDNITTDDSLHMVTAVDAGHYLDIDMLRETIWYDGFPSLSRTGGLQTDGDMFPLVPGDNDLVYTQVGGGGSAGGTAFIYYRHAWS